jgi:hypothetical protein
MFNPVKTIGIDHNFFTDVVYIIGPPYWNDWIEL